ncbi:zinc ABC transporter substrate-binding protein [Nocardioides sp. HDW12B]|uniref:metal ABC transporter substrate-binding protein n=1 Tax=Nocardioides sp. HDW12B TaxID=2714939 RepID=UPI00140E2DF7|nr:metal ABC transporter substrate-binding protein [Nocardioides sp. HDW12B]QIK65855.1 zinc ABC transporter substrate-binding protein [Nocardioides sp. HDW12B]
MFTRRLALPAASLLLLPLAACGDDASAAGGDEVTVVTSMYPLQYLAERIGGPDATVVNLTSPGQEPHDLEIGVQQTAELADADVAVHLAGFQPAVDDALEQNGPERVVDAADSADLLAAEEDPEEHAEHEGEEGHDHAAEGADGTDPHFWLDPERMSSVAAALEEQLAEADPDNAEAYAANLTALEDDLGSLAEQMRTGLASCETDTIVVSHDAFSYLGTYGIEVAPIAGISPDAEPSPARLAELQDVITDEGVTTVFYETLVSPALAETLADGLGIETAVLDPIEGLTDETEDEDYLSLMESNLEAIRTANSCS